MLGGQLGITDQAAAANSTVNITGNYAMSILAIKGLETGNALLFAVDSWTSTKLHGAQDASNLATLTNKGNGQWQITVGSIPIKYRLFKMVSY